MTELLTAAQMRAIEQAAIDSGEVTGLELMERAGEGVVEAIFEEWPELAEGALGSASERGGQPPRTPPGYLDDKDSSSRFSEAGKRNAFEARTGGAQEPTQLDGKRIAFEGRDRSSLLANAPRLRSRRAEPRGTGGAQGRRAVVLCGPGNNGGDGFVVARLLAERGWAVEVFLYGDAEKLPPDARVNYERWLEMGEVADLLERRPILGEFDCLDLVIDALFGIGLSRPIKRDLCDVISAIGVDVSSMPERGGCRHVALDVPTGLDADSGAILMEPWPGGQAQAFQEDASFEKGLAQPRAEQPFSTDLTVAFHCPKPAHFLTQGPRVCGKLCIVDIGLVQTAYDPGVAYLVAKPQPRIWDKARASMRSDHKYDHGHALVLSGPLGRSGAARLAARGALRVGAGLVTVAAPQGAMAECAAQLTAIMLREVEGAAEFQALLEDARINALCLGPGLGVDRARELVPVALRAERATVLDADALTAFKDVPGDLFDQLHESVVLTPHEGEFARLFPDIHAEWKAPAKQGPAYSKLDAARDAAARAGCTILLKGPDTVIANPKGHAAINASVYKRSVPWLATAGSGDVLAGLITGLMARGSAPKASAETGAWLHTEAALKCGPGLIAEDLPEQIPAVFADLMQRA